MTTNLEPCRPRYPDFATYGLGPASTETLGKLAIVHAALQQVPDVPIATEHILHGGMYTRTIRLDAGVVLEGALVERSTVLILNGTVCVMVDGGWQKFEGYNVIPGSAGRKQLFVTVGSVEMTMVFATAAKTVHEAEDEVFADEADQLMSRKDDSRDTITITGE